MISSHTHTHTHTHTQKKKKKKKKKRKRKTTRKREWNEKRGKILGETNLFEESFIIIFTRERTNERTTERTSSDNKSFSLSLSLDFISKKRQECSFVRVCLWDRSRYFLVFFQSKTFLLFLFKKAVKKHQERLFSLKIFFIIKVTPAKTQQKKKKKKKRKNFKRLFSPPPPDKIPYVSFL